MVQLLVDPTLSGGSLPSHDHHGGSVSAADALVLAREEHVQRIHDMQAKRGMTRGPRRGYSMTDYSGDIHAIAALHIAQHACRSSQAVVDTPASIPENAVLQTPPQTSISTATPASVVQAPPGRKITAPRRSQSVTDKEPEPCATPLTPQPPARGTLVNLPSEIHYLIFDILNPLDAACLGLAHSRLYAIHRRKYGKVALSSRYEGPNDMEWAWRGAGPLLAKRLADQSEPQQPDASSLDRLRVKGQVYCRKCGVARCELHRHLRDWMGQGYEYCEIRKAFGAPAEEGAKSYCYMSSPKKPHRCGRHRERKIESPALVEQAA